MMRSSTRKRTHTIALLTDFGTKDQYVSAVKAVLLAKSPGANIIDITHDIEPGNVNEAAYILWAAHNNFYPGTIFVSVVDPGVGTNRAILAVHASEHLFLAPDNGLMKYILGMTKVREIRRVNNRELMAETICATFHGRDVLAPVAASFAEGIQMRTAGPLFQPETKPEKFIGVRSFDRKVIEGYVIHVDVYGNILTNFYMDDYFDRGEEILISLKKTKIGQFYRTYGYAPPGSPFGYVGSSGLLEIAVKNKNASKILKVAVGTPVSISIK